MFGTNEDSEESRGNSFHISCLQRNKTTELEQEGGSRREEIAAQKMEW
jgi:Fe2+ or Zn2+ uptake regulation protein